MTRKLTELVMPYDPDLLVAIPRGGNPWAEMIADAKKESDLAICYLKKIGFRNNQPEFDFATEPSELMANSELFERVVVIDDYADTFAALRGALEIPVLAQKAVAFTAILYCGDPTQEHDLPIPTEFLIREPIPAQLPADSPYFTRSA